MLNKKIAQKDKKRLNEAETISVYFNNEFIGDADNIKITRKRNVGGFPVFPMLEIKGKFYLREHDKR